jgi:hypothetical protein
MIAKENSTQMITTEADVATLFLEYSRRKLIEQDWPRLRSSVEPLTEEQVWWRPNEASNSIGNLILHLDGNVRQYLVASFNHQEDHRDRPSEFSAQGAISPSALLDRLGATMQEASQVLARLTAEDLLAKHEIQGHTVSGLYAVYQVAEHFAMHYGQILYIAKTLSGKDLGFYGDLSKTERAG